MFSPRLGGYRLDMNALEKLRSVVEDLRAPKNPMGILDQWQLAGRLLARFPVDQAQAARVCRDRDLPALDAMVTGLEKPASSKAPDTGEQGPAVSEADMTAALKAFKKRLKLARLADESKLGGRYTSGGRQSQIDAILPPTEFPPAVWKALEKAGKLKHTGQGFYAEP